MQIGGLQQFPLAELVPLERPRPAGTRTAHHIGKRTDDAAATAAVGRTRTRTAGATVATATGSLRLTTTTIRLMRGRRIVAGQQTAVAVHRRIRTADRGQQLSGRRRIRQTILERDGALVLLDLLMQFAVLPDAILQIGHLGEQPRPA